jgi:hypothetical protein
MGHRAHAQDDRPGRPLDVRIVNNAQVVHMSVGATGVASADAQLILRCEPNGTILAAIASFLPRRPNA